MGKELCMMALKSFGLPHIILLRVSFWRWFKWRQEKCRNSLPLFLMKDWKVSISKFWQINSILHSPSSSTFISIWIPNILAFAQKIAFLRDWEWHSVIIKYFWGSIIMEHSTKWPECSFGVEKFIMGEYLTDVCLILGWCIALSTMLPLLSRLLINKVSLLKEFKAIFLLIFNIGLEKEVRKKIEEDLCFKD